MSSWTGGCLSRFWGSNGPALSVLPDIASTDAHWVADDWTGSGSWTSRLNAVAATVTGTPSKTATTQFSGRNEIVTSSGNIFTIPSNAIFTLGLLSAMTWEFIVRLTSKASNQGLLGYYPGVGQYFLELDEAVGQRIWVNNDVGGAFMTVAPFPSLTNERYYMLHYVMDRSSPFVGVYLNGTSIATSMSTSGTALTVANHSMSLGNVAGGAEPYKGGIVEVLHHAEKMSDATILARCAPFNSLRGY